MMKHRLNARPSPSTLLAPLLAILLIFLNGCVFFESEGACITQDGPRSYCFEDKSESACEDYSDTFHADRSCSSAGYAYYCTHSDMEASGASQGYYISRYLNNPSCNPSGPGGSG